ASSEKNSATDGTNSRKAREVCAHNFHSYKKDNTSLARSLAIQILAPLKNSRCLPPNSLPSGPVNEATGPGGPVEHQTNCGRSPWTRGDWLPDGCQRIRSWPTKSRHW